DARSGNLSAAVAIRGRIHFCSAHRSRPRSNDRGRIQGAEFFGVNVSWVLIADSYRLMTTISPFGSWKSPITSALLTSSGIGFSELRFSNGNLYWLESR